MRNLKLLRYRLINDRNKFCHIDAGSIILKEMLLIKVSNKIFDSFKAIRIKANITNNDQFRVQNVRFPNKHAITMNDNEGVTVIASIRIES